MVTLFITINTILFLYAIHLWFKTLCVLQREYSWNEVIEITPFYSIIMISIAACPIFNVLLIFMLRMIIKEDSE